MVARTAPHLLNLQRHFRKLQTVFITGEHVNRTLYHPFRADAHDQPDKFGFPCRFQIARRWMRGPVRVGVVDADDPMPAASQAPLQLKPKRGVDFEPPARIICQVLTFMNFGNLHQAIRFLTDKQAAAFLREGSLCMIDNGAMTLGGESYCGAE